MTSNIRDMAAFIGTTKSTAKQLQDYFKTTFGINNFLTTYLPTYIPTYLPTEFGTTKLISLSKFALRIFFK